MDSGMIEAVQTGNINALYELIQRDPYVLERIDQIPFLDTPLHFAASTQHLAFLLEMINLKPSFARKLNQAGLSPMHLALQYHKDPMVLRLLKFDKDLVRLKGKEGMTPLHHAVQMGKLDILIKFLKGCPEAIEDVTVREETAFHLALKHNKFEAFEVLVGWLRRSCHKAAQSWEKELLTSGDFEGNTVLHIAVTQNRPSAVKLLLENFSHHQINVKNLEGSTALDIARSDNREIYDMLSNATLIRSLVHKMSNSSVGRLIRSLLHKMPNYLAGGFICSLFLRKPNSSTKIDSLRSKMSCYENFKTVMARTRSAISEELRNTYLVVTVLIITASYGALLNPPNQQGNTGDGGIDYITSPSYYVFWFSNNLTFWVSVWLTAFLLPSRSLISLFLLIPLSLFGSCYTHLDVAVTFYIGSSFQSDHISTLLYASIVLNWISSALLGLLVASRIARYCSLKVANTRRRRLLFLILLFILFPFYLYLFVLF